MRTTETENNVTEKWVLTTGEQSRLREQIMELLKEYNYHPTEEGVNAIIKEWAANKSGIINWMKKHPKYNGNYQIVFEGGFERVLYNEGVTNFVQYMIRRAEKMGWKKQYKHGMYTGKDIRNYRNYYESIVEGMARLQRIHNDYSIDYVGLKIPITIKGNDQDYYIAEARRWDKKLMELDQLVNDGVLYSDGWGSYYISEDYDKYSKFINIAQYLNNHKIAIVDGDMANYFNDKCPELKARKGQKTSKVILKVCKLFGIDNDIIEKTDRNGNTVKVNQFEHEYAKFADSINPTTIKRTCVLSANPIDYFTMSFGVSWTSCHTIDKKNLRGTSSDTYQGCYSSGTESYMLDGTSLVFYTLEPNCGTKDLEFKDKIQRNMFHIGEDKILQGRIYPQSTDGATNIYKEIRNYVQEVVAHCWGVNNDWLNKKGTGVCMDVTDTYGTHYVDYTSFDDCNVSFLKDENGNVIDNEYSIEIGHNPICPQCGCEHEYEEAVECEDCYNSEECAECGRTHFREDMYRINGEHYCDDCVFFCEYHDRYEVGEGIYVNEFGRVCEEAIDDSDFIFYDDYEDEYFNSRYYDYIEIEGNTYRDYENAEADGWVNVNGDWFKDYEVEYCNQCCEYVLKDDYNYEENMCNDCATEDEE